MVKIAIFLSLGAILYAQEETPDQRLQNAAATFKQVMATPDQAIPKDLLERAECVVIVPGVKKAAFLVGGQYGRGYASCRTNANDWSPPASVKIAGGSFGYQLGVDSTDLFLLVMNQRGLNHLLSDKFKIGADVAGAAGPVGRNISAGTDILAHAEVLSWSRTRGIFAGVSLTGTVVQTDNSENEKLYGKKVSDKDVIQGDVASPPSARQLMAELSQYPRRVKKSAATARTRKGH